MLEGSPAITAKTSPAAPAPPGEAASETVITNAGVMHPGTAEPFVIPPSFTALVVEDNMLIAMDAEEALIELGATTVQLCPNVAGALAAIGTGLFDVALLDVNLGNETSEPIAMALRERGIPFVMITGFGDFIGEIAAYAGVPVLTKPYAPTALLQALTQVMVSAAAAPTQVG